MEVKFLDQLVCSSGLVNYARETLEGLGEKGTRAVVRSLPRPAKTGRVIFTVMMLAVATLALRTLLRLNMRAEKMKRSL